MNHWTDNPSPGPRSRNPGFTLTELLVALATIAVLGSLLLPALATTGGDASRTQCMRNLEQCAQGCLMYAGDNQDTLPTLKWRAANPQYCYELFRYDSANPVTFDPAGGPYNLGQLWQTKVITNGRAFYCPSFKTTVDVANFVSPGGIYNPDRVFERYDRNDASHTPWPFGSKPGVLEKGTVRSGYSYLPQLMTTVTVNTALGPKICPNLPGNGDPASMPTAQEKIWIALPRFKQSAVDIKHSFVVDDLVDLGSGFSHRNTDGTPAGVNAAFPDGHVAWQGVNRLPGAYDPALWNDVVNSTGDDLRYIMSLFTP